MNQIPFRKKALDRLASPDQLDALMGMVKPGNRGALTALWLITLGAVLWGFKGKIATTVRGSGILIERGGITQVSVSVQGQLESIAVQRDEPVVAGQIAGRLRQPDLEERHKKAMARVADLEGRLSSKKSLGESRVALRRTYLEERIQNLKESIGYREERLTFLKEKRTYQKELVEKGILPREMLADTEKELDEVLESIAEKQNDLQDMAVEQHVAQQTYIEEVTQIELDLNQAKRDEEILAAQLEEATDILATCSGRVVEIRAGIGDILKPGDPLLLIEAEGQGENGLHAVLFLKAGEGNRVKAGMDAHLVPGTVKREEYGFMRAEVMQVADFPATQEGMKHLLGGHLRLAEQLTQGEAPIVVIAKVLVDENTPTGYAWSSSKGPKSKIHSGTTCLGEVAVKHQAPVALILPFFRKIMGQ